METAQASAIGDREPFVRARGVSKHYGAFAALEGLSLDFFEGEIHALVGENGAGKSTLMALLAGEQAPTRGQIEVAGYGAVSNPAQAMAAGIAVVHQQFQLVDTLTVAENIFLGRPLTRSTGGPLALVDRKAMQAAARKRLLPFGLGHRAGDLVADLTVGEKQLVEICRSMDDSVRMLILDEPTASLGDDEIATLFGHVRGLCARGAAVVLIAHNIEEVLSVSSRISVLRNGRLVGTRRRDEVNSDELVRMIVGRDIDRRFPKNEVALGSVALEASGVMDERSGPLTLRRGEILGLPSFIGSGVDELLDRVSGVRRRAAASLRMNERELGGSSIGARIKSGLAIVPGNTLTEGLIPGFSIEDNILLPNMSRFSKAGIVARAGLRTIVDGLIRDLDIRPADRKAIVSTLSGGNRQKVILAKWLASGATVFVMNDPTKAVDVGAKVDIYRLLGHIVEKGGAVLLSSSDTDELVGLADRVIVLKGQEVLAEFNTHPVDKQALLRAIVSGQAVN